MTKTTNCGDKMILGQAREGSFVYISVTFLLVTKFFLFLFFFLDPHIRIFIYLLNLHTKYLSPKLGGLRLHLQDFCHIWNILVSFCLAI